MARRNGRPGNWLAADDYTGFTKYASELKQDFWGAYAHSPLKRNLQEIATPLNDPYPVEFYRAQEYEYMNPCEAELAPVYVGLTNVRTNLNNAGAQALHYYPYGVGEATIGCTFRVG